MNLESRQKIGQRSVDGLGTDRCPGLWRPVGSSGAFQVLHTRPHADRQVFDALLTGLSPGHAQAPRSQPSTNPAPTSFDPTSNVWRGSLFGVVELRCRPGVTVTRALAIGTWAVLARTTSRGPDQLPTPRTTRRKPTLPPRLRPASVPAGGGFDEGLITPRRMPTRPIRPVRIDVRGLRPRLLEPC